jgi:hypothetical protein
MPKIEGTDPLDTNPHDMRTQIALLAMRVDNLGKEKEALERKLEDAEGRLKAVEKAFQRGAGIMMILPFAGTAIGLLLAYGKVIFAPWTKTP